MVNGKKGNSGMVYAESYTRKNIDDLRGWTANFKDQLEIVVDLQCMNNINNYTEMIMHDQHYYSV